MALRLEPKRIAGDKVNLRFAYSNGTRKYFPTGVVIPLRDFNPNSTTKPVRSTNPDCTHLNRMVKFVYDRIMDVQTQITREDKVPTGDFVFRRYKQAQVEEKAPRVGGDPLLSSMLPMFFANRKAHDEETTKLYKTMIKQFVDCCGEVRISEIDLGIWNQFQDYLFEGGRAPNTVNFRMNKLKSFLRFLRGEGLEFPLVKFPLPPEEIKNVKLESSEVEMIRAYLPRTEAMLRVKDLCVFQCRTGLRISDLRRLCKLEHIRSTALGQFYIDMRAYKTNTQMCIPLFEPAMEILNRYDFKLPKIVEQHYNRELKKLLKAAGVDRRIDWECRLNGQKIRKHANLFDVFTNHCCGRTAIEYFFSKGYTPAQVATIVGKSISTIMKYYMRKSTTDSILDKARQIEEITGGVMSKAV